LLVALFATLALLLAATGIYGVLDHAVAVRRREIGVRAALGASGARIASAVAGRMAAFTLVGLVLGCGAATGIGGLVAGRLVGVDPRDPLPYGATAALVAGVGLLAGIVPVLRACRVEPHTALRAG